MGLSIIAEIRELQSRIRSEQLDLKEAARQIGIAADALPRHLGGAYVRCESLAKYRRWLAARAGGTAERLSIVRRQVATVNSKQSDIAPALPAWFSVDRGIPNRPHLVVDLFSGAGGMSAGFDLLDGGAAFETVLAV